MLTNILGVLMGGAVPVIQIGRVLKKFRYITWNFQASLEELP